MTDAPATRYAASPAARRPIAGAAATAAVLLVAACGGSSSSPGASSGAVVVASSSAASAKGAAPGNGRRQKVEAPAIRNARHPDPIHRGTAPVPALPNGPPSLADRAESSVAALKPLNPCGLVTRAEAQSIIGQPVAQPQEAPLGPTCIYRAEHGGRTVTIALEGITFSKIKAQVRHTALIDVSGRSAYCGTYGRSTTFVPLAKGRLLNVTAPCSVGAQFAAKALSRLRA